MDPHAPSQEQLRALMKVAAIVPSDFYLAGGVAFAAYFGHRSSRDLDLFSSECDVSSLAAALEHNGARIESTSRGTIHAVVAGIPVSLIEYKYPLLLEPQRVESYASPLASLPDLIAMKLSALASRGARRDFWDLYVATTATPSLSPPSGVLAFTPEQCLTFFARKFSQQDLGHVVRSLSYFADAENEPMPRGMDDALWSKIVAHFRQLAGSIR